MKKINLKGTIVEFYDGIKELPATNWNDFQKLFLKDVGIGNDMAAVGSRLTSMFFYLQNNKVEQARQETINLHNTFYYAIQGINVRSYCLAAFIHSVDGKPVGEVGELMKDLSKKGLTNEMLSDLIDELKKKLMSSYDPSFLISSEMEPMKEFL